MTEEQKSFCHADTPSNGVRCEANEVHTSQTHRIRLFSGKCNFCLRIHFSHHNKTLRGMEQAKDGNRVPKAPLSITGWLFI